MVQVLLVGIVLFAPAGTLRWWRAWVFLALFAAVRIYTVTTLWLTNKGLLAERAKRRSQPGQPGVDKLILQLVRLAILLLFLFIPLDVFRFHLLPRPAVWLASLGLGLYLFGWWLIIQSFRANAFAAPVIKHDTARAHHVVDTGVYRFVRHPLYAGAVLLLLGMCLWLESTAGLLLALIPLAILVVRIGIEERFLVEHLEGYAEYRGRVRSRLVPGVW